MGDGWYRPHSGTAPDGTPYRCVLIPVPPCFLWVRTSPDGPPRLVAWDGGTLGGTDIPGWTFGSNRAEVVAWRPAPDGPADLVAEAAEWWKRFAERQPKEPEP